MNLIRFALRRAKKLCLPEPLLADFLPPHLLAPPLPHLTMHTRMLATKQVKGHKNRQPKVKANAGKQEVEIRQWMTASELARAMNRDFDDVLEALLHTAVDLDDLDPDTPLEQRWIKEVVTRCGMKFRWAELKEARQREDCDATPRPPDPARLLPRPAVVTIMGHVDHGKTTLLDRLRRSQTAALEAGGITQHIGAFLVELPSGERITFMDTPGHAAFSSMRARGARATDIVVLVVAADDGIMTQTVESIQHARGANVPIIVAVNKCDKQQAKPEQVKQQLLAHDVVCEEFGGDVQAVHISAAKGENLVALGEAIVTLAELQELRADPSGPVEGVIIESRTDRGKGPVTTAIIQQGTLQKGCVLVAGRSWAKVRFLFDEHGGVTPRAGPSSPVQIVGWKDLPSAGDQILEVESEQRAREVVQWRCYRAEKDKLEAELQAVQAKQQDHAQRYQQEREGVAHLSWRQRRAALYRANRQQAARRPSEREQRQELCLPLVIKGDMDGSLEAILNLLESYDAHEQCQMEVVHHGIGDISENDVSLAETFSGSIYGFNVSANKSIQQLAAKKGVALQLHQVIYKMIDGLKEELSAKLPPRVSENVLGEAGVLAMFEVSVGKKKVAVAGCRVQRGVLDRRMKFRVIRDQRAVWEGSLTALKHHKDEVQTVKAGMECGLSAEGDVEFRAGDSIVCYEEISTQQLISWDPGF